MSVIIVGCILLTKKRKYKRKANISWCTAATTLFIGIFFTFFFAVVSIIVRDNCIILEQAEVNKSSADMPLLYPQEVTPLLNACLFSTTKNMADYMGFGTAALALNRLKGHAISYKKASESEILLT